MKSKKPKKAKTKKPRQRRATVGKTAEQIVNDIQESCKLLGWNIAMDEGSPGIKGLVIGVKSYVEHVIGYLPENETYAIYSSGQDANSEMH